MPHSKNRPIAFLADATDHALQSDRLPINRVFWRTDVGKRSCKTDSRAPSRGRILAGKNTDIIRRNPMIRSCALAAFAGLTLLSGVNAEPLPTETFKILPGALAVEAAQAAVASCKGQGYNISVAVVDRAGDLKLLLVGDGASALSRRLSRRKAYTAAMRRVPTGELAKQVATPGAFNPTLYDTRMVALAGGLPIKVGNETIGAIGVSGAPGGDKDEACANAGLAKVADRLN
jgi:uncharacterized protein GlcG (DUF336 family)